MAAGHLEAAIPATDSEMQSIRAPGHGASDSADLHEAEVPAARAVPHAYLEAHRGGRRSDSGGGRGNGGRVRSAFLRTAKKKGRATRLRA